MAKRNSKTSNNSLSSESLEDINKVKEEKFIGLMTEIIVSITLKELYEDGKSKNDKIS